MSSVTFRHVWKLFGDHPVVRDLNLEAQDGEFLVVVGASGCGKTTTMRMLAGLEVPTHGSVIIDDQDVTLMAPGDRDVSMVFQSYALYPHMNVLKNLTFGPRVRRESKVELKQRVADVADILGLTPYLDRRPEQLSGGQRQRVALGRVMLRHPRVSLLDEPLSNLDAALRVQMREELVRLQQRLNLTTVYVTHDQIEAMTMGHRIAVMEKGVLLQVDTPQRIYEEPESLFVATFIGSPKMNIVPGAIGSAQGMPVLETLGARVDLDPAHAELSADGAGQVVSVGIRPHDVFLEALAPARCSVRIEGLVDLVQPTGVECFVLVNVGGPVLNVRVNRASDASQGSVVRLALDPHDLHLFDEASGRRVLSWRRDAVGSPVPPARAVAATE